MEETIPCEAHILQHILSEESNHPTDPKQNNNITRQLLSWRVSRYFTTFMLAVLGILELCFLTILLP